MANRRAKIYQKVSQRGTKEVEKKPKWLTEEQKYTKKLAKGEPKK